MSKWCPALSSISSWAPDAAASSTTSDIIHVQWSIDALEKKEPIGDRKMCRPAADDVNPSWEPHTKKTKKRNRKEEFATDCVLRRSCHPPTNWWSGSISLLAFVCAGYHAPWPTTTTPPPLVWTRAPVFLIDSFPFYFFLFLFFRRKPSCALEIFGGGGCVWIQSAHSKSIYRFCLSLIEEKWRAGRSTHQSTTESHSAIVRSWQMAQQQQQQQQQHHRRGRRQSALLHAAASISAFQSS